MPNNATNPFNAAAASVMRDDNVQAAGVRDTAPSADQLGDGYPTLARYLPASHDAANTGVAIAPPAVDPSAREAADLMAHAAILRASADMERDQPGADLAQRLTKQEFIERYCERSGVTWEGLSRYRVALPCRCGDDDSCEGWVMVRNDTQSILEHENGPAGV